MILLYGGGGEPGAGEIPMDLFRKQTEKYQHWYPVFYIMLNTGMV